MKSKVYIGLSAFTAITKGDSVSINSFIFLLSVVLYIPGAINNILRFLISFFK